MNTLVFGGRRLFMKFADLEYFRDKAAQAGLEIVKAVSEDDGDFARVASGARVISVIDRRIDSAIIDGLKDCVLIQTLSVGYDCVDVEAATERGIAVCNTPAYCTHEVAAHTFMLILAVARKVQVMLPRTRGGAWDYNYLRPIPAFRGRTLGIVGLGRIGRALVPMASGVGMKVSAYDPYQPDDLFRLMGVERCHDLGDLLGASDYLSIHANLTPETDGMVGEREIGHMKRDVVVVNTARGRIWDEAAVVRALQEGRIAGVGADVLTREPPPADHPLLREERALVTPHVAWYSEESLHACMVQGMDEILRAVSGKRPRHVVNPEIYFRSK